MDSPRAASDLGAAGSAAGTNGRRSEGIAGHLTAQQRQRPGTFDFLGFTHFWGKSRMGANVVKQQTAAGRLLLDHVCKLANWFADTAR
jgi:hypothetical protein